MNTPNISFCLLIGATLDDRAHRQAALHQDTAVAGEAEVAAILVSAPAISSELDRDPRKWPTQIPKATALESANSGLDENRTRRDSPGFSAFVRITFMRVNLSKAHTPSTHFHCKFFATRNSNG